MVTLGNLALMRLKEYALNGLEMKARELSDQGRTPMFVALDKEVKGIIAVADAIRPESKQAVQAMQDMGLEVVMLTGDNPRAARAIAAEAGIQSVLSEMTPDQKTAQVQALQQEGRTVAMVGDGINDAPALAQADVGIAIGTGIDVAMEAADITLMHDDVRGIPRAVEAVACRRTHHQAEPVLGLLLQHGAHPRGGGCPLPVLCRWRRALRAELLPGRVRLPQSRARRRSHGRQLG